MSRASVGPAGRRRKPGRPIRVASVIAADLREPTFQLTPVPTTIMTPGFISGHFDNAGNGGTLSFGAPACMVINAIETRS